MKNSKIFIIEDEFIIVEDIQNILLNLGYQISGVTNTGESVFEMIKEKKPDLILMDIMLKGKMDGIETAENLIKYFDIPLVYMTAFSDENTLRRAKITEPFGYILKPFDARELYAAIEMALYRHNANQEIKKKQYILQLIADFNEKISTLSSNELIINSMKFIKEKLNFDHISIALKEKNKDGSLKFKLLNINFPGLEDGSFYPYSKFIKNEVMQKLQPLYRPDLNANTIGEVDKILLKEGIRSCYIMPLIIGNICIGTLNVSSKNVDGISATSQEILSILSPRLALSIQNSLIFNDLSQSEERFRSFTNFIPQLVAEVNFNGKLVFVNNAAYEVFGYSKEDFQNGLYIYDMVISEEKEKVKDNIHKLFLGEEVTGIEYTARRKDNTVFPIVIHTNIIYNKNTPMGILALVVDISEHKKIEESLAKEKELLSVTLRSIGDGVITTDINGKIILMNNISEIFTGWSFSDGIGKDLDTIFNIAYEKKQNRCEDIVTDIILSRYIFYSNENIILTSKDKIERIVEIKTSPLKDKDNQFIGVVIVFHDITEKNKMQEEIIKIKKLESLGVLAGGIAHDFNNLLTAILGNITLAKIYTDQNDKVYEILLEAEKATMRSRDLTQQLLTFSKGGIPVKKAAQIADLIIESTNFILRGSNIKCNFEFQEDLWVIEMDVGQMNQVINNLILNASQAMKDGGNINIRGRNFILDNENNLPLKMGNYIKIEFQDFGIGISRENISKIFDPYFTTKEKGAGLGLAVTYSIIHKHNGYIEVDSKIGEGTTFTLYLPSTGKKIENPDVEKKQYSKQKASILLMDDEEIIREVGFKMLTHIGYDVTLASNGNEVIDLYNQSLGDKPFDVIIMDLTVPGGMGGKEVIKYLLDINPDVKAIVSSGYSTDPVMSNFKDYGFKAVMIKPYKIENIIEILYFVLSDGK